MMTWVSLRSGMASSATRCMDHQPATQAANTSAKTTTLFSTEKSMMRLIMGASGRGRPGAEPHGIWVFIAVAFRVVAFVGHHAVDRILNRTVVNPGGSRLQPAF